MTPKEKAKELVNKFIDDLFEQRHVRIYTEEAMLIALISVDEIIKTLVDLSNGEFTFIYEVQYWQEVKQEIENI
jgi:uncharacterized UPF0146 family protein